MIGITLTGTFTAIDGKTNKIAWQNKTPYRMGGGGGSTVTASGLLFRGDPDGNFVAIDANIGEVLWKFQTGFGADAPSAIYEVDGYEYIAIATGGNSIRAQRERRRGLGLFAKRSTGPGVVATAAANLPRTRACAADLVGDFLAMGRPAA